MQCPKAARRAVLDVCPPDPAAVAALPACLRTAEGLRRLVYMGGVSCI